MPRLSYEQVTALASIAKWASGGVGRFGHEVHARTRRALLNKSLVRFDDKRATYLPTVDGERALYDHGYEKNGTWRGSNQPRKYR